MNTIADRLESARNQLVDLGVATLQFVAVMLIAMLVVRWMRRRVRPRFSAAPSPRLTVVAENGVAAAVYVVALTIVLALWGLTWSGIVTALSISTVAVLFGFQDLLRSVVGGMLVMFERPFALGDRIKIRDIEGRVERIDLRTTVIRADNGDRIAVPNALVFSDPVINRSPNRVSRILLVSGIDGDPADVRRRAELAFAGVPGLDNPPSISVRTQQGKWRGRRVSTEDIGARATGLRIAWSGDGAQETEIDVRRKLQAAFPNARITHANW